MNLDDIDVRHSDPSLERPIGRDATKERGRNNKSKVTDSCTGELANVLKEITKKRTQSQMLLIEQANEMLKLERDRVELERKREEREQQLYEERIIGIDTSNMDEF